MKKLLIGLALAAVVYQVATRADYLSKDKPSQTLAVESGAASSSDVLAQAYAKQLSNVQVWGQGAIIKILQDDNDGSRHQRFILRVPSGQTVLIAHNIDLAPRIASLREGDVVEFFGEYEWNSKGGVVHWTHRDPAGRHVAGWVKHKGRTYQ